MSNELPNATVEVESASAGGLASGNDNILVLSPFSQGPLYTPRIIGGSRALLSTFGYGDGSEFLCHYFRKVRKKACVIRMPSTTPGAVEFTNDEAVAGTSVITVTGVPHRRFNVIVDFTKGGTIGAEGIEFRYSINGGLDWSGTMRLGTATTFALANTGLTLNFAAGTIVALDTFYARTTSPEASTADYADAITQAIAMQQKFRAAVVIGEFSKAEAQALQSQIDNLYAEQKRPVFFISARDWYDDVALTGNPTLAFANANPDTITRGSGSWITDGFKVGMTITVTGSTSNNGVYTIAALTATVLTLDAGDALVVEAAAAGRMVTGEETEETWIASLLANYAGFEDEKGRIVVSAGMTRMHSEIFQVRMRVPFFWGAVERWMQHDLQISPNRKKDGPFEDHFLSDDDGNIVEHDARANDALNEARFFVGRTYLDDGGTYAGTPATMAPSGSAFGVIPWVAVANLMSEVVQKATEDFIGDNPETDDENKLTEEAREQYNQFVNEQLEAELLSPKREGPRASAVSWTAADDDILNVPNALINGEGELRTLGLVGSVHTKILVNPAS